MIVINVLESSVWLVVKKNIEVVSCLGTSVGVSANSTLDSPSGYRSFKERMNRAALLKAFKSGRAGADVPSALFRTERSPPS